MVELDTAVAIDDCLERGQSFIVEAGPGSGKTRSLVESIQRTLSTHSHNLLKNGQQIVCVTFTKRARDEVIGRLNEDPLVRVSTIHEFLWKVIGNFQGELRMEILEINESSKRKIEGLDLAGIRISYWEYARDYQKGLLTHEDIIELSNRLFKKYPKLSNIVSGLYPYIFVDEYQDTDPRTIELLLDQLVPKAEGRVVIGLFGDEMQKIYTTGVGKVTSDALEVITKSENYRCSLEVIKVLNKLRPDLQQTPTGNNLDGEISLFHSNAETTGTENFEKVMEHLKRHGWASQETKVLVLTHRGIATKLSYPRLLEAYELRSSFGRDDLMNRDDEYGPAFVRIEELVSAYEAKRYGLFISLLPSNSTQLERHEQKVEIRSQMEKLNEIRTSKKIHDVLKFVFEKKLLAPSQRIRDLEARIASDEESDRVTKLRAFHPAIMDVAYQEVINVSKFIEEETPFSTKHGVKGEEYENVLVVVEDGSWTLYNFQALFAGDQTKSTYKRTLNLFYVCCSRSKNRLAILCQSKLDAAAFAGAEKLFGTANMFDTTQLSNPTISPSNPNN